MIFDKATLQTSADRDKVNTAMRATPEWRNAITAMGHNPDGPLKLTTQEQAQLAQQLGLPTDDFHIDAAGNANDFHGWRGLPTWAKVAVVAGAGVATMGAAGAFGGIATAAAPEVAMTTTPAITGGVVGGTGVLGGGALGAAGTALTATQKIAGLLHGGGQALGNAGNAAEINRLTADTVAERGLNNYENQNINRAQLESSQRQQALKDMYRASYATNRTAGPNNAKGLTPYSASYLEGLSELEKQGLARLKAAPQYGTDTMKPLVPFKSSPLTATEHIANWGSPAMALGGMALDYFGGK